MAVQKLNLNDFLEVIDYALIGIHSNLESYRLAYFLNKQLQIRLARQVADLDFENQAQFEIFEWVDTHNLTTWHLVSNHCQVQQESLENVATLFQKSELVTNLHHLIPEFKKVNYFLKISDDGLGDAKLKRIINSIQSIPNIVTAYRVNPHELKSKNNLIFY